ncbi:MAG: hypothetical protein RBQ84_09220 [Arcobacter sp.]|uniref:hypothetical protein n=1 Tax=unclassified Arcobacter TaxID=2593671 RepID=UPI0002296006|nr:MULTISPECIES: hypothetical protein [unclassified Arcobacter]MDY3201125.1 hypothetical protein [Arcobacter sp.]BAK72873.1 conserved hypothetical protein [Arcobacter sp. L]
MKQILALILFVFVFFGCTQKQVVELKLPNKNKIEKQVQKEKKVEEDSVTVVEEFTPIDIKESDIKEETIPNGSMNTIDEENINIQIDETKAKIQIAFIYPSSLVSKYAKNSMNTISGYLSYKKADYNLVVIDCENESYDKISSAFSKIEEEGITKVIALFTPNAINTLNKVVSNDLKVYLPLIEKKDSLENNDNLIFGSISYDEQLKKLSYYSTGNNAMFYQDTYLGSKLKRSYDNVVTNTTVRKEIKKNETNFKNIVNDYRLKNSSLFLNTDLVKTSLILSQLRAYDVYPKIIFSTQLNYDPMLMILTQDKDREKLVIANSIDSVDAKLKDEITTFGGNITYEWVDYSTLVGINYLYNDGNSSSIPTQIVDNEVIYTPRLFKSTEVGFLEIK